MTIATHDRPVAAPWMERGVIVHYHRSVLAGTGPGEAIATLCNGLVALGERVRVLVSSPPTPGLLDARVEVRLVWERRRPVVRPVITAADLDDAAVLVIHGGLHAPGIEAARAARRAGVPYVITSHGNYRDEIFSRRAMRKGAWLRVLERRHIEAAAAVHCCFEEEARQLRARLGRADLPVVVAPNAVEVPAAARWRGGRGGAVVWLGRFDVRHKGLDLLIDGLALVPPERRPIVRLYGAPTAEVRCDLEARAARLGVAAHLEFHVPVHGAAKWDVLAHASGFVSSSRWEGFGIALGEALAAGLPVVTTPVPLGLDVAASGGARQVEATAAGIAAGLEWIASAEAPATAEVGRRVIAERYSPIAVARAWLDGVDGALKPVAARRPRVLLSAYACKPDWGSEPSVGWNWAVQAARVADVWVLTKSANRELVAAHPASNREGLHWVYLELPTRLRPAHPGGVLGLAHYVAWQGLALVRGAWLHRRVHFDLAHHVTYNAIDLAGFLPLLGIPFVWGPVGGGQLPPESLREYYGADWSRERWRRLRKRIATRNPWSRWVARRSTVLAANEDTARLLREMGARRLLPALEAGVGPALVPPAAERASSEVLEVAWAGALIPRKAPRLALEAVARARELGVPVRLIIAGDGPRRGEVEAFVRAHALADDVALLGRIPHTEMASLYQSSDVFLFTSLQDTSGNVVLEAMAAGRPVVCLDHQGVREIVADDCGIRVRPADPASTVEGLARALEALHRDPARRREMGRAASRRVDAHYRWDGKVEALRRAYALAGALPSSKAATAESVGGRS